MNEKLITVSALVAKYFVELMGDELCHLYEDDCTKCPLHGRHRDCGSVDAQLFFDDVLHRMEMRKIGLIKDDKSGNGR